MCKARRRRALPSGQRLAWSGRCWPEFGAGHAHVGGECGAMAQAGGVTHGGDDAGDAEASQAPDGTEQHADRMLRELRLDVGPNLRDLATKRFDVLTEV